MQRLRLVDARLSRLPEAVGLCQSDTTRVADIVNASQRRLLLAKESGDEGWWGTYAVMAFSVSRAAPYLTTPRDVARLQVATVCTQPVEIQNQFYEYLQFGNGRLPKNLTYHYNSPLQIYSRNTVPLFTDPTLSAFLIQIYCTNAADVTAGKRILIQGTDNAGNTVRSTDNGIQVQGEYVNLGFPFAVALNTYSGITGIQKDVTVGEIQIFQIDPTTAASTLLLTMQPSETTAAYRRYYFDNLPTDCCDGTTAAGVTVTGIVKLDLIPAVADSDYLLIQNLEALTEEAQSVRYSTMDSTDAKQLSRERHNAAIQFLIGELTHYLGVDKPALHFKPFGSACLAEYTKGFI